MSIRASSFWQPATAGGMKVVRHTTPTGVAFKPNTIYSFNFMGQDRYSVDLATLTSFKVGDEIGFAIAGDAIVGSSLEIKGLVGGTVVLREINSTVVVTPSKNGSTTVWVLVSDSTVDAVPDAAFIVDPSESDRLYPDKTYLFSAESGGASVQLNRCEMETGDRIRFGVKAGIGNGNSIGLYGHINDDSMYLLTHPYEMVELECQRELTQRIRPSANMAFWDFRNIQFAKDTSDGTLYKLAPTDPTKPMSRNNTYRYGFCDNLKSAENFTLVSMAFMNSYTYFGMPHAGYSKVVIDAPRKSGQPALDTCVILYRDEWLYSRSVKSLGGGKLEFSFDELAKAPSQLLNRSMQSSTPLSLSICAFNKAADAGRVRTAELTNKFRVMNQAYNTDYSMKPIKYNFGVGDYNPTIVKNEGYIYDLTNTPNQHINVPVPELEMGDIFAVGTKGTVAEGSYLELRAIVNGKPSPFRIDNPYCTIQFISDGPNGGQQNPPRYQIISGIGESGGMEVTPNNADLFSSEIIYTGKMHAGQTLFPAASGEVVREGNYFITVNGVQLFNLRDFQIVSGKCKLIRIDELGTVTDWPLRENETLVIKTFNRGAVSAFQDMEAKVERLEALVTKVTDNYDQYVVPVGDGVSQPMREIVFKNQPLSTSRAYKVMAVVNGTGTPYVFYEGMLRYNSAPASNFNGGKWEVLNNFVRPGNSNQLILNPAGINGKPALALSKHANTYNVSVTIFRI